MESTLTGLFEETDEQVYVESEEFTGWIPKSEVDQVHEEGDVAETQPAERKPEGWHEGKHVYRGADCPREPEGRKCSGRLTSHIRKKDRDGRHWQLYRCPHCKSTKFRSRIS